MRYALLAVVVLMTGCVNRAPAPAPTPEPPPAINEPAAPPNQRQIGFIRSDGTYCVYDPEAKATKELLPEVGDEVCYSDDGTRMAWQGADGAVVLADLTSGAVTTVGNTDRTHLVSIAISPDGSKLAWVDGSTIKVWSEGAVLSVSGPEHPATPSWSPDGSKLAVGAYSGEDESKDDGLWLWEGTGAAKRLVPPIEGWGAVGRIQWSPDGKWLAWERGAGDAWTGDLARSDGTDLRRDEIGAGPRQWLPDSSGLVVEVHIEAGAFSTGFYTLADRKLVPLGPENAHTISCLSPDGTEVLVFGPDREARLINLAAPATSARWDAPGRVEVCHWGENDMIVFAATPTPGEAPRVYASPPMGPAEDLDLSPRLPVDALRWLKLPR